MASWKHEELARAPFRVMSLQAMVEWLPSLKAVKSLELGCGRPPEIVWKTDYEGTPFFIQQGYQHCK